MANSKLKNCPFCGSKAKIINVGEDDGDEFYMVQCKNEECGCGACFGEVSKSEIAKLWNNRHGSITVNNFGNGEQIENKGHLKINVGK